MGKTTIPKYYARYKDQAGWHDMMWSGRATDKLAEQTRKNYNESFNNPEHPNYKVSEQLGYVPHISEFYIIRNDRSGTVVASAKAPMFEVV